jgi:hypothetical protein
LYGRIPTKCVLVGGGGVVNEGTEASVAARGGLFREWSSATFSRTPLHEASLRAGQGSCRLACVRTVM